MQPDQAFAVLQFLIPVIEREHATTVKVLSAVPAGRSDYSPDPKSTKALDLVWHIASSEQRFLIAASTGVFPAGLDRPATIATPAVIIEWYQEQTAANLVNVKRMGGDDAARIVNFHTMQFPAVALIQLMISHSIHHRGQLSAYLRPMGALVPSIYGASADAGLLAAQQAKG